MHLVLTRSREQLRPLTARHRTRGKSCHHRIETLRIGPRVLGLVLRTAELGRGNHLHGLGDLPRRLDAVDPVSKVLETWHRSDSVPQAT